MPEKISALQDLRELADLVVPGSVPYKKSMGTPPVTPTIDREVCSCCGLCVKTCPDGAITVGEAPAINVDRYIFCCACIRTCPEFAVFIEAPPLLEKRRWLHENYSERKSPEVFL